MGDDQMSLWAVPLLLTHYNYSTMCAFSLCIFEYTVLYSTDSFYTVALGSVVTHTITV